MTEFVHLIGAEEVQRASHNMSDAVTTMLYALNAVTEDLGRLQIMLDNFLIQLREIMEAK